MQKFQFIKLRQLASNEINAYGFRIFLRPSSVEFDNAINSYPNFDVYPGDKKTILFSKTNLNSISSKENPCIDANIPIQVSCVHEKAEIEFIEAFGCKLPWMKTNTVLDCPLIESKNDDNGTIYYELLGEKVEYWRTEILSKIEQTGNCRSGTKCKSTLYNLRTTESNDQVIANQAKVEIKLDNPIVQNVVDSYSYNFQSLVGEVGGTLGLFLGLSIYSLVEFVTYFIEQLFNVAK